jgi:hypothetical protein
MSLYTALAAVKALPHLSPVDLEESAPPRSSTSYSGITPVEF